MADYTTINWSDDDYLAITAFVERLELERAEEAASDDL